MYSSVLNALKRQRIGTRIMDMKRPHWMFDADPLGVNAALGAKWKVEASCHRLPWLLRQDRAGMHIEADKKQGIDMTECLVQQAFSAMQIDTGSIHLGIHSVNLKSQPLVGRILPLQLFSTLSLRASCLEALQRVAKQLATKQLAAKELAAKEFHTATMARESMQLFPRRMA